MCNYTEIFKSLNKIYDFVLTNTQLKIQSLSTESPSNSVCE